MKKLNWRLSKLPTPDEVRELVKDKIITQDEAREILFNQETEEDRDKKSLESEIKFLRQLVDKLSNDKTKVVEVIREVQKPYFAYSWYRPYDNWCGSGNGTYSTTATSGTNLVYAINSSLTAGNTIDTDFSDIKTF